jgi:hypothetical protein
MEVSHAKSIGILQKAFRSSGPADLQGFGSRAASLIAALRDREAVPRGRGAVRRLSHKNPKWVIELSA